MSDDTFVYRSTEPGVLALEATWLAEDAAYKRKVKAFKRKHPIKDGHGKLRPLLVTRSNGERVVGYECWGGDVPEGWKFERKMSTLSPKRGTKIGKAIAADMDACTLRDLRRDLADHGMISHHFGSFANGGFGIAHPGVEFMDGACWVTWSLELKPDPTKGYDPAKWEPVKLSAYYAAKERNEEKAS
jgi:hypothetical protein